MCLLRSGLVIGDYRLHNFFCQVVGSLETMYPYKWMKNNPLQTFSMYMGSFVLKAAAAHGGIEYMPAFFLEGNKHVFDVHIFVS